MSNKTIKLMIHKHDIILEAWYTKGNSNYCALLLPPHPSLGGNISNANLRLINKCFTDLEFSTVRLNYRGIGSSQGDPTDRSYDLEDSLDAIDWLSNKNPDAKAIWVAGFGYGGYIAINAAMRRPSINGFVSVTPHAEGYFDLNVLTPCPNGIIINGSSDKIVDYKSIETIANELSNQKDCEILFKPIEDADHNYTNHKNVLENTITSYLDSVLSVVGQKGMVANS